MDNPKYLAIRERYEGFRSDPESESILLHSKEDCKDGFVVVWAGFGRDIRHIIDRIDHEYILSATCRGVGVEFRISREAFRGVGYAFKKSRAEPSVFIAEEGLEIKQVENTAVMRIIGE